MESARKTILFMGDQTDPCIDGIDYITKRATHAPWLKSFMGDLCRTIKAELKDMEPAITESLGNFQSLQELAERYRGIVDETGVANAILIHAVRAAALLQCVKREPHLLSRNHRPEWLGISGGILSLSALAVATDFASLYDACLWVGGLICRTCKFCYLRSRAVEDCAGTWGWAVLGISKEQLRAELEQFQLIMGIPEVKRAHVAISGDRWNTIIGPPSVLKRFLSDCPAINMLPKNELNIHSLQHSLPTSPTDLDYLVGNSTLCDVTVGKGCKIWGTDEPLTEFELTFSQFLRPVLYQALSRPLDIVKVVKDLKATLVSHSEIEIKVMGPSSHLNYLASTLKAPGRHVKICQEISSEHRTSPRSSSGRIAVVGMAGRGPGCDNLDEFWNIISEGRDLHREIPKDRFDIGEYFLSEYYQNKKTPPCATTSRFGCFMDKPGNFDARFFKISPREALFMDPGHRQFLMSACDALETAGYSNGPSSEVDPRRIGVFYGQSSDDWHNVAHHLKGCDAYTLQGSQRAFGAGRLAFHMNWEGPTYSVDSACASTLSSLHLACMSLLSHDIDMAVTGAANIIGHPHTWSALSKAGILSMTGNCKTFRDDADGYCRADFVGSVVLKRLEDAVDHNDNILAVIAGTGRNHSGNSPSITTSDAAAQEQLFRNVLEKSGVLPDEISYVEMHGTGTQIGDPAEMTAVSNVFSGPLSVGSIKANIGHSEAAAGISSLLKSILVFEKSVIPPQAGMPHRINPKLDRLLQDSKITIPTEAHHFNNKTEGEPRHIFINNFDAAGGNSCLLLEDPRGPWHLANSATDQLYQWSSHVIVTTAKTPSALRNYKCNLLKWLHENPDVRIQDVAYTTNARRKHHQLRSAYVVSSTQDLIARLESDISSDLETSKSRATAKRPVVFMFTGQGSHYAGMGGQLYRTNSTFRQKVDHCARICSDHGFPSFARIITDNDVDMSAADPIQVQLAVLTLEIAVAAVWVSDAGLAPSMVMGHSLGEYAALHIAGVLSLVDVLYLVGHRTLLLSQYCEPDSFSMLAVSAPMQAVQAWLNNRADSSCSVACTNSPRSTVIAGTREDIKQAQAEVTQALGARTKLLPIPYAFHSHQMDPIMKQFKSLARAATFLAPKVPVTSTLLATVCDSSKSFDVNYLWRQTREECRFSDAVKAASAFLDDPIWLEIGPAQVLGSFVSATISPSPGPGRILSTLETGKENWTSLSKCLARLTEVGIDLDWRRLYAPHVKSLRLLRLPTYAWDLQEFWITHTEAKEGGFEGPRSNKNGQRRMISTCAQIVLEEKSTQDEIEVRLQASTSEPGLNSLIRGHRVRGVGICPGSVFVDAAVAGTKYLLESNGRPENAKRTALTIRNLTLNRPMTLDSTSLNERSQLITTATLRKQSRRDILISFHSSGHALGGCSVMVCDGEQLQAGWNKMTHFIRSRMNEVIRSADTGGHKMQSSVFYALFSNTVQYDAAFKSAKKVYVSEDFQEAVAEVVLQQDPADTTFASSPYFGESLVHLAGFVLNANPERPRATETTFIMSRVESLEQPDPSSLVAGETYFTFVHVSRRDGEEADCDVYVFDSDAKQLVMQCSGLRFHETDNRALDQLLGKPTLRNDLPASVSFSETTQSHRRSSQGSQLVSAPSAEEGSSNRTIVGAEEGSEVFESILKSICTQTATAISELRDDVAVADLGVDSIMAIEITSDVRREGGSEFPASFLTDYPTIGDLRRAFARSEDRSTSSSCKIPYSFSDRQPVPVIDSGSSSDCEEPTLTPDPTPGATTPAHPEAAQVEEGEPLKPAPPPMVQVSTAEEEAHEIIHSATARIMLLHGNPKSGQVPLYLLADGTGSIATYLHLNPLQSNAPVYGIDSPFSRAPEHVKTAGITGIANIMVRALVKARPEGPFNIGGFSGGGMLGYEVSRQLADAGRQVDGLLIIDMACPRSEIDSSLVKVISEAGFEMFRKMAAQDPFWSVTPSSLPMRHLLAFFDAVGGYHPEPMTAAQRPRGCAIIWAEKGLIARCSDNPQLRDELADMGFAVTPYPGFMQDPALGAIAWGVPDKCGLEGALGPNGWDEYVGGNILCKSVSADHLDMLMPGHVHMLQAAIDEAVVYFEESTK